MRYEIILETGQDDATIDDHAEIKARLWKATEELGAEIVAELLAVRCAELEPTQREIDDSMSSEFVVKIRKLGNSKGVIIPTETLRAQKFDQGDYVKVRMSRSNVCRCVSCNRTIGDDEYCHIINNKWVCDGCFWRFIDHVPTEDIDTTKNESEGL